MTATNSVGYVSGTLTWIVTAAQIVPTASISGPNPLLTNQQISLIQGGTTNFPLGWTQGTMWNPDGTYYVLPETTSYQTQYYTLSNGPGTYSWQFRIVDYYQNYTDQWVTCSASDPVVTPPTSVTAATVGSTFVSFNWSGASATAGILDYLIYRNGAYLATTTNTSYQDNTITPSASYSYVVYTVDRMQNQSGASMTLPVAAAPDFEIFTPIP